MNLPGRLRQDYQSLLHFASLEKWEIQTGKRGQHQVFLTGRCWCGETELVEILGLGTCVID